MLNDLNALIGFEIELKIRGPTIYLQNYYLIISFYCNYISTLNSLFLERIARLVNQCFLLGRTSIFFI